MFEKIIKMIESNANFEIAAIGENIINVILHDENLESYWDNLKTIEELLEHLNTLSRGAIEYEGFTEYTIDDFEGDFIISIYKMTWLQK